MFTRNFNIHFKIVNYWFTFVLFLIVISNLPHQEIPFFSWFNCSIYFLIFLQSIYLFSRGQQNRFVFLNIALFSLFHSASFISIYVGDGYLFGDDYLRYFFFEYKLIMLSVLPALCVIHLALKYFLKEIGELKIYALTVAIVLPILLWHYHPFLMDKELIFEIEDSLLYKRVMLFDFLPLSFLVLYGILLYRYDWSMGEHINTLMVCFFIITIMDITNLCGNIYKITVFNYTQYVLLVNLTFFLITMFRLVNHSCSAFGQLYESIMQSSNTFGVPIKRRKTAAYTVWQATKAYFLQWRNTIGFSMLVLAMTVNFSGASDFVKINLAVMAFGLVVLLYYLTALYHKRLANGNILNVKKAGNRQKVKIHNILEGYTNDF